MYERGWLTKRFDEHRPQLRGLAYRMLGSLSETEDVVQEAWLRLHRIDPDTVDDLGGWLTAVVSRVCLHRLRLRRLRHQGPIGGLVTEPGVARGEVVDPEDESILADSVDVTLLRLLDTLTPDERLAFVLHHLFAMPFDEIGSIVERSPTEAKQLARRARRHVRMSPEASHALVTFGSSRSSDV